MEFFDFLDRLSATGKNVVDTAIDFRLASATRNDDRLQAGFVDRQLARFGVLQNADGASAPGNTGRFGEPGMDTTTLILIGAGVLGVGTLLFVATR